MRNEGANPPHTHTCATLWFFLYIFFASAFSSTIFSAKRGCKIGPEEIGSGLDFNKYSTPPNPIGIDCVCVITFKWFARRIRNGRHGAASKMVKFIIKLSSFSVDAEKMPHSVFFRIVKKKRCEILLCVTGA